MRRFRTIAVAVSFLVMAPALFAETKPVQSSTAYDFIQARLAADEGDYNRALDLINRIIAQDPSDPILLLERASIYLDANRSDQAIRDLTTTTSRFPDFYDAQKLLGRVLLDVSKGERAKVEQGLEHLQAAYRLRPDDVSTGMTVAQILTAMDKSEQAAPILANIVERIPDNRTANYQYAQLLTKLGRGDESEPYLARVVEADPTFAPAVFQLADIYQKKDEWKKAAALLQPLVEQDPANVDLQRQQAFYFLRGGESQRARELFAGIVKVDPKDERSAFFLAESLSDLGHFDEANAMYRKLLVENPTDPELLISYGLNQLSQQDLAGAEKTFNSVAALQSNDIPEQVRTLAKTQLAAIEHRRGNYDSALQKAQQVLSTGTQLNSQAVGIALDVYRREKKYGDAIAMLRKLEKDFPTEPGIGARLIEFLTLNGNPAEAKAVVVSMQKQGMRPALAAAEGLVQAGLRDDAVRLLESEQKQYPDDNEVLFQLGATYERAGRVADAEKTFLSIIERQPDNAGALNYLGYMWADRGVNLDRAEDMLLNAVRQDPRNGAYIDSLGWVYFRLGKFDLAEKYLRDASDLMPRDPTIQVHLGDVLAKRGEITKALDRYKAALTYDPDAEEEAKIRSKIAEVEKTSPQKR